MTRKKIRVAALADIHVGKMLPERFDYEQLFKQISEDADVFVMCGDLTDHGLIHEAEQLVSHLQVCSIPKVAVLGNHDYSRGEQEKIKEILVQGGVHMLGDEIFAQDYVGFAGVKGFGGGFGNHMLGAFGEDLIKRFVQESINEGEQLEIALDNIGPYNKQIVAMHYAPIPQTNKGEPLEIYPFLGSSRFEEVINRHPVSLVLHGHAHYGSPEGMTAKKIPVYNVSLPLLQKLWPKKPYRIVEL